MNDVLDSRQLRVFVTLARCRSFTRAARELHLTPSAVSHSLRALEEQLGCRLLNRVGRSITLTLPGEQLLPHAKRILQEMTAAREAVHQLTHWGRGRLRLMASATASQYLLPSVLRPFKDSFPEYSITLEAGDTPAALAALIDQRIDLALGLRPSRHSPVDFRPLFVDRLLFLVSPAHPWAVRRRAEVSDIPRQLLILYAKNSVTFRMIEEYFGREGISLCPPMELANMEAIKELVKLGLGITIMAPWVARRELAEGSLVALPLGRRALTRCWGVLHARGKPLTLAEETFIRLCTSVMHDLVDIPADSAAPLS